MLIHVQQYMGEYQIVVHFDVPHHIHVIWSGYCAHYRYGVFSREEGMIKFILTLDGLFFFIKNNNIATTCMTHFPQLSLSNGEVGMNLCFLWTKANE